MLFPRILNKLCLINLRSHKYTFEFAKAPLRQYPTQIMAEEEQNVWIECCLKEAERKKRIAKVLSVDSSPGLGKGENYLSDITKYRLRVVTKGGDLEERRVLLKSIPKTAHRGKFIKASGTFVKETRIYTEVLPKLESIRREKESGEPLWPECFGCSDYTRLLFEDLSALGYKMADRMLGLDYEHSALVMQSLARFHALSAVIIEREEINLIPDFTSNFMTDNIQMMGHFYNQAIPMLADVVESEWSEEWSEYVAPLRRIGKAVVAGMCKGLERDNSKFMVLTHGDCWVNNLQFKHDRDGKPEALRFVDFQMTTYNIPALDLEYFFTTSTQLSVRRSIPQLLQVYYDALVSSLAFYGYAGEVPSHAEISDSLESLSVMGLGWTVSLLPIVKKKTEDVGDLEEMHKKFDDGGPDGQMDPKDVGISGEVYAGFAQALLKEKRRVIFSLADGLDNSDSTNL